MLQKNIQAVVERRCYRKILDISYLDHITNEQIRKTIQHHIGPHEDLLTTAVKKRKLRWCGHVTRSSGLAKTVLQGTVEGRRRRGRQKKRWTDNIEEWTGKPFAETQALAHTSDRWNRLVPSPSVRRPDDSTRS